MDYQTKTHRSLPREKLSDVGVEALTNAELLAIVFNVGTRKERVFSLANRIIRDYGMGGLVRVRDYRKLRALGLSELKSMQLLAVLEIGRRFYGTDNNKAPLLNSAARVYDRFNFLVPKQREELHVAYLNNRQRLIASELIALGTAQSLVCQPRDVLVPAFECGASCLIIVHNHPSGDPYPSTEDITLTRKLEQICQQVGLVLVDHVVVAREGYFSFQQSGLLTPPNS